MSGHTDDVVRCEQIDSAFAEGVRACLQRLYAANVRTDEHRAAWEDCETLWKNRTDQVIASRVARKNEASPAAVPNQISAKAREWAANYPEASDGRNTFILFAEWVESLVPSNSHADLVRALEECRNRLKMDLDEIKHLRKKHGDFSNMDRGADEADKRAIARADAALATLTARKVG